MIVSNIHPNFEKVVLESWVDSNDLCEDDYMKNETSIILFTIYEISSFMYSP